MLRHSMLIARVAEEVSSAREESPHGDFDWQRIHQHLNASGNAVMRDVLDGDRCDELIALYSNETKFRSRVVMARHGFGRGEYKYFAYPMPNLVQELRGRLYAGLVPIANA